MSRHYLFAIIFVAFWFSVLAGSTGCSDEPPDTSAPQRAEIDRGADWQSALLYIADENGPVEGWGSIRIYDNVSGFVEETVEQNAAAAPSDMFVTADGGSMYVASSANGAIDKFRWNGNNWIDSGVTVDMPATSLTALVPGPDGMLYATSPEITATAGGIYKLDPVNDKPVPSVVSIPGLTDVTGIAWPPEGAMALIAGKGPEGSQLVLTGWPSITVKQKIPLPVQVTHEVVMSPDGRLAYVMSQGEILLIDPASGNIVGTLKPSPDTDEDYYDATFSADGKHMFVTGASPAGSGTLYVVDISSKTVVHKVGNMGIRPRGIQRVE